MTNKLEFDVENLSKYINYLSFASVTGGIGIGIFLGALLVRVSAEYVFYLSLPLMALLLYLTVKISSNESLQKLNDYYDSNEDE